MIEDITIQFSYTTFRKSISTGFVCALTPVFNQAKPLEIFGGRRSQNVYIKITRTDMTKENAGKLVLCQTILIILNQIVSGFVREETGAGELFNSNIFCMIGGNF